jgi:hypothetical protein
MPAHPPFRKIFEGVASRQKMFELLNRHGSAPFDDRIDGTIYAEEWFELNAAEYDFMLDILPPLFMRTGMFGMSEYKAGYVTSVFLAIRIRAKERWFHGFCDLSDRQSPDAMRAAIIAHETAAIDSMTRAEKLEAIWNRTPDDYRGIAGDANPNAWPPEHRGKRTILVKGGGLDTILKLLEDLTDEEIQERLTGHAVGSARSGGKSDADPS